MTSPDERADSGARNDAIKLVEEALRSGRIVQADHDMRVDQLRNAQSMQDVDLVVRDLRAPGPSAPPTVAPVPPTPAGQPAAGTDQPWPLVNYGPGSATTVETAQIATAVGKSGKLIGGIIAFVVLIAVVVPIAGAAIAFFAARDSFPDFDDIGPTDDTTYLPGQAPGEDGVNLHTVEGYQELVDAVRDETGHTYSFSTVLYPRYAVLEIPTGTNNRYENFYWDGDTLELQTIKGTTDAHQVDIGLIDPQLIIDCLDTVRARTDDPESWYAVISDSSGSGGQISCYASNDFGETTYIVENLDGTVVYDSEQQG